MNNFLFRTAIHNECELSYSFISLVAFSWVIKSICHYWGQNWTIGVCGVCERTSGSECHLSIHVIIVHMKICLVVIYRFSPRYSYFAGEHGSSWCFMRNFFVGRTKLTLWIFCRYLWVFRILWWFWIMKDLKF